MSLYMVFDCESVGLHGETFAVGWVVIKDGAEISRGDSWCAAHVARGNDSGRKWVAENVPARDPKHGRGEHEFKRGPKDIRRDFWLAWEFYREQGAVLAADCLWPVEARFLAACVDDDPENREWGGPYPFVDVASVRLAAGLDPLGTVDRLSKELPAHDPLCDARQSARLLMEALKLTDRSGLLGPRPV